MKHGEEIWYFFQVSTITLHTINHHLTFITPKYFDNNCHVDKNNMVISFHEVCQKEGHSRVKM